MKARQGQVFIYDLKRRFEKVAWGTRKEDKSTHVKIDFPQGQAYLYNYKY